MWRVSVVLRTARLRYAAELRPQPKFYSLCTLLISLLSINNMVFTHIYTQMIRKYRSTVRVVCLSYTIFSCSCRRTLMTYTAGWSPTVFNSTQTRRKCSGVLLLVSSTNYHGRHRIGPDNSTPTTTVRDLGIIIAPNLCLVSVHPYPFP